MTALVSLFQDYAHLMSKSFNLTYSQGWKPTPKPKPKNPVLKEIFDTKTETDTDSNKFLKT